MNSKTHTASRIRHGAFEMSGSSVVCKLELRILVEASEEASAVAEVWVHENV